MQLATDHDRGPEPDDSDATSALDCALGAAELDIYASTVDIAARARTLEATARGAGLSSRVRRARLLASDALSRRGELGPALASQLAVLAEAETDGDRLICARSHCLLASTYDRLADIAKSQAAAVACVRLLDDADPLAWRAEHMMVLALFSSYRRDSGVDFATFDEALRLARLAGEPMLVLAVLNNYAFVALDSAPQRALALAEEMIALATGGLSDRLPATALDTIALALLAGERLDEAASAIERALALAPGEQVEPATIPACLITAARIDRARGEVALARRRLLEARRIARGGQAGEPAAVALRLLSELAAQTGDYREAYLLLRRHLDEFARYQSERNDTHAATIQAIYGAELERRRRLEVEELADTDPLTGLPNRRYLDRRLGELAGTPLALALLDIDHFKQVNDLFSHDVGDAVLRRVADLLRLHAGDSGADAFAARLGGEEFVVVLPGAADGSALGCCERVRAQLQASDWGTLAPGLAVTASIGLALDPAGALTPSELLAHADALLYEAKRAGRNRVATPR